MVCQLNFTQALKDSLTNNRKNSREEGIFYLPHILVFFIIILFLYMIYPIKVLEISNYPDNEVLQYFSINNNSYIGVIYTHSVEKTETSEWYKINNDKIILMEQRFKSQGAGLPSDSLYDFEKYKDGYRLYNINKEMIDIIYRTGRVVANHKLDIDGKEYNFREFSSPGEAIIFRIKNISRYKVFI